jgi:hypothetical protein
MSHIPWYGAASTGVPLHIFVVNVLYCTLPPSRNRIAADSAGPPKLPVAPHCCLRLHCCRQRFQFHLLCLPAKPRTQLGHTRLCRGQFEVGAF